MTTNDLGWLIAIVAAVFALGMYVATRRPITINNNPVAHAVAHGPSASSESGGGVRGFLSKVLMAALLLLLGITLVGSFFKVDVPVEQPVTQAESVYVAPPVEAPVVMPTPTVGVQTVVVPDVSQPRDISGVILAALVGSILMLCAGLWFDGRNRRPRLRRVTIGENVMAGVVGTMIWPDRESPTPLVDYAASVLEDDEDWNASRRASDVGSLV